MKQKREIRTVSLIGLGAIGCFWAICWEVICA